MHVKETIMESSLFYPLDIPYDVAYRKNSPAEPVSPHSHNAVEIYLTRTALPDVLIEDQLYTVEADTLIIIPAFSVHQLYHEMGIEYERYVLSIKDSWIKNVFGQNKDIPSCLLETGPAAFISGPEIISKMKGCLDRLLGYRNVTSPEALCVLFELIGLICDYCHKNATKDDGSGLYPKSVASRSREKVNEMISYIQDHLSENPAVVDISEHFHLNPDYMSRLFKSHVHIPIGRYISIQKIVKAQELLRKGKSVSEVSDELGYSGYAYFFRSFQKVAGISPSRYRMLYSQENHIENEAQMIYRNEA